MSSTGAKVWRARDDDRAVAGAPVAHEREAGALVLPQILPDGTTDVLPARKSLFQPSVGLSILAHFAIVAWLAIAPPSQPGSGGLELDAIGVEIVEGAALESASSRRSADAAGGATSVASDAGADEALSQPEIAAAAPAAQRSESLPPPPTATVRAEPESLPAPEIAVAAIVLEKPEPRPSEDQRQETPAEPEHIVTAKADKGRDIVLQAEQVAVVTGAAASRAAEASTTAAAAASSSPGQLARFAMQVRQSLGQARPRHMGARGRVHVAFVLSDRGTLISAGVARSSANARLDEAALAAVRTASFPQPPAGATEAQRTFLVPFDFQ